MNKQVIKTESKTTFTIDKEKILSLLYKDKVKYMDALIIKYPKLNQILEQVDECYNSVEVFSRPLCMRIQGPSGSGKTTISSLYMQRYPDIKTPEGDEKCILYSVIPCPAYIGGLASTLLHDLGDPFYNKHSSIASATQRLYHLLKACNVKMIFLDEVQHLVDRNSQNLLRDSSDWFKGLIDGTKIPIVFLGLPDSDRIFCENEQLANRVRIVEDIYPFQYDDLFRKVLYLYDSLLPLKDVSGFAESDLSKRIYIATKGGMKNIHELITHSAIFALQSNNTRITMPMLAKACDKLFYKELKINPFYPGVDKGSIQELLKQF